ncbi:ABC transporter ATP-binding protein [Gynuella sunshinyii]|uniref:Putative ABC-type transport system involved in lysophospholipase L1 biosynthesis, ATPase component n=1 Tax=Gynuella sunshinyii YC6258 TaxID=1445510 RepID=A0A0C5VRE5_9GAMM|nr:ABC transporter ATP-binding protein [Gynuella sunshinyii]AJQ95988.1 putative ABC-type transport system involved in lysophospholipase L1 biosynthesis, ATPase component [Gynuella sunshinyii YC6258]
MIKSTALKQEVQTSEGQLTILKGIDLEIKPGESVAIVGASGSGKSTLLGLLAGLDTPSSGQIYLQGEEITRLDEEQRAQIRGRLVAFVFQNFQLLGSLTALENVMLPLEVRGVEDPATKAREVFARVGLTGREHHYPKQLSGGEQQRVAIARAFASEAPIMFADEPTGNLDTVTGGKIADLLFELNEEAGTTLVLVTHDIRLASRCHRQIVIEAGAIVEPGQ